LSWCEGLGALAVGGYGCYVLTLAAYSWRVGRESQSQTTWLTFGLPICLALDNLVAGVGRASSLSPVLAALILGTVSGVVGLGGLRAGATFARWNPTRAAWLGGLFLILFAVVLCVREL